MCDYPTCVWNKFYGNFFLLFINEFYLSHNIPLDVVYTGKMMMGVLDLVAKDYFPKGSTILTIHSGGLQGNKGMSKRLGVKLPS